MSKTFGYANATDKEHWFPIDNPYLKNEIEAIRDPEGGQEIFLPTAIPSPFARIDLVKTAFQNINRAPNLKAHNKNGDVIASKYDEKLVSDCLDLVELLFNFEAVKDKVKIIIWDRNKELEDLKQGSDPHRRLGETLELYLSQDSKTYNFDSLKQIFLIEYNYKIIGATSPSTLFFTTGNDLAFVQESFTKNRKTFSEPYAALYEREPEFQRYFYLLFKANPQLKDYCKDLQEYLAKNLKLLEKSNPSLCKEINELEVADYTTHYAELKAVPTDYVVNILGVTLKYRKAEKLKELIKSSDFIINCYRYPGEHKPLVLQNEFNKPYKYINDLWDSRTLVPYLDPEPVLEKRKLPGVEVQYPYLTVSDFLEPYLVRLPYPMDKTKFFNGNLIIEAGNDSKSYLLPLKPLFFDYFHSHDLLSPQLNKPKIQMRQNVAGSVIVELKIPVRKEGEHITFQRTYYQSPEGQASKPDAIANKGIVIDHTFGLAIFPFLKAKIPGVSPLYRVQLIDGDTEPHIRHTDYSLEFMEERSKETSKKDTHENTPGMATDILKRDDTSAQEQNSLSELKIIDAPFRKRSDKNDYKATTKYFSPQSEFDLIRVKTGLSNGFIIPAWPPPKGGNGNFSFAVDFGTTNTHIEYQDPEGSIFPFDITSKDIQFTTLFPYARRNELDFGGSKAIYELLYHEFLPFTIGPEERDKFPHRTIIAYSSSLNETTGPLTLADYNIPFFFEKVKQHENLKTSQNLKWAKQEKHNSLRVTAFLEEIIWLIRNKVLLNGGNLPATKITWFYPTSMTPERKGDLQDKWDELYKKYIAPNGSTTSIPESLAPYFSIKNETPGSLVVSIDIGGETSDVVIFDNNEPLLLTSFRFAGNAIFGDGFSESGDAQSNILLQKYVRYFNQTLSSNNKKGLLSILSQKGRSAKSDELNAFLFSIYDNLPNASENIFSYNYLLSRDPDSKIIFLYLYTAILYHIAQIMQHRRLGLPKHLAFSGTGSKLLSIISASQEILEKFSRIIFEKVFKQTYDREKLTLIRSKTPKEITSKGGLKLPSHSLDIDIEKLKIVHSCLEENGITELKHQSLDDNAKELIIKKVRAFNTFFLDINSSMNFNDYFGVSPESYKLFEEGMNDYLKDYLEKGLQYRIGMEKAASNDAPLDETLFFYPILGAIKTLSNTLAKNSNEVNVF